MLKSAGASLDNQTFASPTFTGVAGFGDGAVATPSIYWTSDSDGTGTGLYRNAANTIGFSCNGVLSAQISGSGIFTFANGLMLNSGQDASIYGAGTNSIKFGNSAGTAISRTEINKSVTAFTNAVAKATFTVTVPNAAHNATLKFTVNGALGAGGAIGAGEAMATNTYMIGIVRTAGVATVATATAASNAVAVAVAGANTVTATMAVSAMSGAVGATQTFTLDVTISRSAGTSDNHTAQCYAELLNINSSGITIA